MSLNVRELECFLAVVDHGSITRAASALYLAQPSLSQIIRRLESDLGVELFRRVGRGLVLAPAGEALVGPARQIVRDLIQVRNVAQGFLGLRGGRLDVAMATSLTTNFIAAWIGDFRRRYPDIGVRLTQHDGDVDELVQLIRSGATELAYTFAPTTRQGVECIHLADGEIVLALPPGWTNDFPDPVPLDTLGDLPFVYHRHPGLGQVNRVLDEHGFEARVVVEVNESAGLVPLVLAGAGAAFLPMRQAIDASRRGASLRTTDPPLSRALYAIAPSSTLSLPASTFLDLSQEHLQRWGAAVRRRTDEGMTTVEASLESDASIQRAFERLMNAGAERGANK